MRRLLYIFLSLIVISSCRRELCYDYHPFNDVTMEVDWKNFNETPSGMTAMFYPVDGGEPTVYSTHNIHKAKFDVRTGTYNVILFNQSPSEFSGIGFHYMDKYDTAEIYAVELESKTWYTRNESEIVVVEPEPFALATYENFEVIDDDSGLSTADVNSLFLTPRTINVRGRVEVHVDGVYNLRSVRGCIKGIATGVIMHSYTAVGSESTHLLEHWQCFSDADNPTIGTIVTEFSSFGLSNMNLSKTENTWKNLILDISVLLVDNSTVLDYRFPIGEIIDLTDNKKEIVLKINIERDPDSGNAPLDLPDVPPSGGGSSGFDADMDSWGDEIEIQVPVS